MGDHVIVANGLTKHYGPVPAVSGLSFEIGPGVTGFLGPNGAGKTTTLQMVLGLARPDAGTATIGGQRYADLPTPSRTVGAVLDSSAFHPGSTAVDHLRIVAAMSGVTRSRVDELIDQLGIRPFAHRRTGGFSTGMRQRLNLATALLGDPPVLVLDEPSNGLDPAGMAWLRRKLRSLADEGRTVLISSHVLAEIEQVVDRLLVIAGGRLAATGSLDELRHPGERLEDLFLRLTDPTFSTTAVTGAPR
ncbi:ABC transporter ATP-binding protein [Propionibacteriaceae bacterium Y1685]|uniref:ABC transporter ATP-binding protein n=1 Tax=Microlunatus sp. Y1700 TaxID=3418487 RepID=UPI003B7DD245